ncbi:WD40-repeat-containing domain protein [Gorgonomyces haynaldii]|nr:WD40-repeat-containing domain protein [Gorgonomyces haynaldii]
MNPFKRQFTILNFPQMLIFKPEWVNHSTEKNKATPIYSIHVHPNGEYLATGGQDSKIKIWNTASLLDQQKELDEAVPKLVSTLVLHNGAVLSVRWSIDGEFLATGSDDTKVVIWTVDRTNLRGSSFGETNLINYRAVKVLTGHESDVVDLGWSPSKEYLASCGLDSKIIIWDAVSFERLHTIDRHDAFVKGITWDPCGYYLASQSDDKTVRVFRTSDWEEEEEISANFTEAASTTFFRRLSWSPDGGSLVTANGENGALCVAPIIYRKDWSCNASLVGHQAPIEVALFNPLIYQVQDEKKQHVQSAICAVGSQDQGISVWSTAKARAIVSAQHLFQHSCLDLAWSPDGNTLYACSYDGSIACLIFAPGELGKVVDFDFVSTMKAHRLGDKRKQIPESAAQLQLERRFKDAVDHDPKPPVAHPVQPTVVHSVQPAVVHLVQNGTVQTTGQTVQPPVTPQKQVITVTKDGKKRIQPIFLQSPGQQSVHASPQRAAPPVEGAITTQYVLPMIQEARKPQTLTLPHARSVFTLEVPVPETEAMWMLEIKNMQRGCRLSLMKDTEQVWYGSYPHQALLATMTHQFFAVHYADSTLCLYSTSGRKLTPPMKMESGCSYLVAKNDYILHLNVLGQLNMWNIKSMEQVVSVNVMHLLHKAEIVDLTVSEQGLPLLTTSLDETWMYHFTMKQWMLAHNNDRPTRLETTKQGALNRAVPTLEQIEDALVSSQMLDNGRDFQYWLKLYARKLADEGHVPKTMELCYDLAGLEGTQRMVEYLPKLELLKEIMPILSQNRSFSRILQLCQSKIDDSQEMEL